MTTEIESPYWNIFESPIENNSTESYEYVEYREINVEVKALKKYKIPAKDLNVWIHPHNSYLHLKGKVLKSDGTALLDTDMATLTNNGFNLFSTAKYRIGDKEIESIDYVGIGTTVLNLVDFSDDYAKSAASNMFWFKDTANSTEINRIIYDSTDKQTKLKESDTTLENLVMKIKGNHNFNEGFLERWKLTKSSKQISLFLPLNRLFGFCKDINRVFKGLPHEIELEKNLDDNVIHRSGTDTYKFEISHLSWFVPIVTPSLTTMAKLETYLATGAINSLFWESYNVYRTDIRDDKNVQLRITSTQHKPSHIFVVFQKKSRTENQAETNMVFDHMNLSKIQVKVGNKKVPEETYACDFSPLSLDYSRIYTSFLSAGYKNIDVDTGTVISYNDFAKLFPIFHFDLTSQETSIFENSTTPEIIVNYTLEGTPGNYYVFCIVVSERKATIQAIDQKIYVIP
jgi:hypothetical protein